MIKSKLFLLIFIIAAIIIFIAGINSGRVYKSEADILLLPKNEQTTRNIEQIMANAKQIPFSLSFYNKMLELNPDIEDAAASLPDYKRKDFWKEELEIMRIKNSGILKISVFNGSQFQSEITSRQVAQSLSMVLSRYYDIRTDLDIRIIDGPIVSNVVRSTFIGWIIISLLAGFASAFLVYFIVNFLPKADIKEELAEKLHFREEPSIFPKFSFPPSSMKGKTPDFDFTFPTEEQIERETYIPGGKKASAPENLPIVEIAEEAPVAMGLETKPVQPEEMTKKSTREATPEEVKERLNKLLSGGM